MEANELRIGNLVRTIHGIKKVSDISVDRYCWFTDNQCEPIKLTEEWLVKFGFEKIGTNFRKNFDFGKGYREFVIWFNINEKTYNVKNNNYFTEIKTVHNLQNLYFSLTNKELTTTNL